MTHKWGQTHTEAGGKKTIKLIGAQILYYANRYNNNRPKTTTKLDHILHR